MPIPQLLKTITEKVLDDSKVPNLSLENLVLLVTTNRVSSLEEKVRSEYAELKERQKEVQFLHTLLRTINATTDSKDAIDWSSDPELQKLLQRAQELGVEIPEGKTAFNSEEKLRLVENVKMSTEDLNLQNELQLQAITRLTNERYEMYQMARSILRPIHDVKMDIARKFAGR